MTDGPGPLPPTEPPAPGAAAFDRRIISVLFADLVGFTSLSERLDSEDVATIQDAYFSSTRETIERYGGVVEKFIGDAAMAVFGAPRARDGDAERAVRAGLALIGAIEQISARLGLEPETLQLRVGVNTGEVVHAMSGPDAGRVTGDTVNTAARFQAAARPGTVLIGELTTLTVAETIETRGVGTIELKGKAEPVRAWEAVGVRPQPSREEALGALRAPMLGRSAELAGLADALARVAREQTSDRCLIVAPPGVGKSRLLAEFAALADGTVLRARVRPQGTAPYETVVQLFLDAGGDLAAALTDAEVPGARAAVILGEVGRLLEPGTTTAGVGGRPGRRARSAIRCVGNGARGVGAVGIGLADRGRPLGGRRPTCVPRLRGASYDTTRAARRCDCAAEPARVGAGVVRGDVRRPRAVTHRRGAELVHALVGAALPEDVVVAIAGRSDGTPLFIEELLRTWASVGTLVREGATWILAVPPGDVTLPQTVQAIYAAQLDDLPPDARLVARRGAVSGRQVPLSAFGALELDDQSAGLDVLRRRALLADPLDDPITGESYAYRHALLRDAGYASLARAERARLHVAMAHWLEEDCRRSRRCVAEAIGEHYALALECLPALPGPELPTPAALAADAAAWYERAAAAAVSLYALDAVRRLFRARSSSRPRRRRFDRARRRLRLGETLAASAELDLGIEELEASRAAFALAPETHAQYEAATFALARAFMQQMRFPEATRVTQDAIDRLGGSASGPLSARLHALHAWSVAANGGIDGVFDEIEAAWAAARDAGDPHRELDVFEYRCMTRDELRPCRSGRVGAARAAGACSRALAAGRRGRSRRRDAHRRSRVRVPRLGPLAETVDVAAAHGLTEQVGWGEYARCETLWLLGDWDAALEAGLHALDLGERFAYERLTFRTFLVVLQIAAERGDAALAARWDRWWTVAQSSLPRDPVPVRADPPRCLPGLAGAGERLPPAAPTARSHRRGDPDDQPPFRRRGRDDHPRLARRRSPRSRRCRSRALGCARR